MGTYKNHPNWQAPCNSWSVCGSCALHGSSEGSLTNGGPWVKYGQTMSSLSNRWQGLMEIPLNSNNWSMLMFIHSRISCRMVSPLCEQQSIFRRYCSLSDHGWQLTICQSQEVWWWLHIWGLSWWRNHPGPTVQVLTLWSAAVLGPNRQDMVAKEHQG